MATTTVQAPTVRKPQRAADYVAAAGAERVLLFGWVACGRATAGSDIDLVAISVGHRLLRAALHSQCVVCRW